MNKKGKLHSLSILILFILTLAVLAVHCVVIYNANHKTVSVSGRDESADVYMDIDFRNDSTSSWLKREFDLYGEIVDLTGATLDGTLYNNGKYDLRDWSLRIDIKGDCMINQAWTGEMEIHQYVGTDREQVQRINLQNYEIEDVSLDHLFDGDLLIPLQAGDYLIYHPSEDYDENVVESNNKQVIGFIFYYLDDLDLANYTLDYTVDRDFETGAGYYLFLILCLALFGAVVSAIAVRAMYRSARKEFELRTSAISCMSDIYQIIYIINPQKDELLPVSVDEASEKLRPHDMGAAEQLANMFRWDAEEEYLDLMLEFTDLKTILARLKDRQSIVCDYVSKHYGWCRIRIFAMDAPDGRDPEQILFTIQMINEEKKELEGIQSRVSRAESQNIATRRFLEKMADEIRTPLNRLLSSNACILERAEDPAIRRCALDVQSTGMLMASNFEGVMDYSHLAAGSLTLADAEYSLKQLILDIYHVSGAGLETAGLTLKPDVSPKIPDRLRGDAGRLKNILVCLIVIASSLSEDKNIRLSVFGKTIEDRVHLLISVRADGAKNVTPERIADFYESTTAGMSLKLVRALLGLMGAELKTISDGEQGCEFYFELEQQVLDTAPVGSLTDALAALFDQESQ